MMKFYFAEVKDEKIFALHESTTLDLIFRDSDGLLIELNEQEHRILTACKGDTDKGISMLMKVSERIKNKIADACLE